MDNCIFCGKETDDTDRECKQCRATPHRRKSDAWYLLPILFGLLGGVIMYFVLHDENHKMAKKGFFVGLIMSLAIVSLIIVNLL